MPIELKEFLVNLKNWDFDISSSYQIDENEGQRIIKALEKLGEDYNK